MQTFINSHSGAKHSGYTNDPITSDDNKPAKEKYKIFNNKTPKVLLVEDTPTIQLINTKFLKLLGCDVDLAKDGIEAVRMFENGYDLVLTDVGLPGISGIEAAAKMRQIETTKHIPIIAITAYGDSVFSECINAGINEAFEKPIMLNQLSDILSRWLDKFL